MNLWRDEALADLTANPTDTDISIKPQHNTTPCSPNSDIVVMKFGGTSVADAVRIRRAARRIVDKRESGARVVAVLSARGKTTDELIAMAAEVSDTPDPREMDMLLSTGERISCALCAMAIHDLGHHAISLTGSQAGIVTDSSHTRARIIEVRADRIMSALGEDRIVLVAGFQGVSTDSSDVTTLGRGGSDTTAVALAAAVGAEVCEIYTDVPGVFSADPRIVPDARKLDAVSFEEMLEMAASGAGVSQLRSVEYARNHGVRIYCRSSFDDGPGTIVVTEADLESGVTDMTHPERPLITAVTHSSTEARITLVGVPDELGAAARIFEALAEAGVDVDMIDQNVPTAAGGLAKISFTVPRDDLRNARNALEPLAGEAYAELNAQNEIGKVSIVGAGMRTHPGVAARVFRVLADEGINMEMISTSPIKISCVIPHDRVELAVHALHEAFELSGSGTIVAEQPFASGGTL
ncbi:MAG TPA: aspartate kinase [Solirubrobacteraceae bacterium]|nr:aspartate kinase [Solirubrobacteraceae bacterium]